MLSVSPGEGSLKKPSSLYLTGEPLWRVPCPRTGPAACVVEAEASSCRRPGPSSCRRASVAVAVAGIVRCSPALSSCCAAPVALPSPAIVVAPCSSWSRSGVVVLPSGAGFAVVVVGCGCRVWLSGAGGGGGPALFVAVVLLSGARSVTVVPPSLVTVVPAVGCLFRCGRPAAFVARRHCRGAVFVVVAVRRCRVAVGGRFRCRSGRVWSSGPGPSPSSRPVGHRRPAVGRPLRLPSPALFVAGRRCRLAVRRPLRCRYPALSSRSVVTVVLLSGTCPSLSPSGSFVAVVASRRGGRPVLSWCRGARVSLL
ncbi:hypothetical protein SUDANB32_06283 [Streptomyces sp. enrichment culture]